jgi:hypothetical protein
LYFTYTCHCWWTLKYFPIVFRICFFAWDIHVHARLSSTHPGVELLGVRTFAFST